MNISEPPSYAMILCMLYTQLYASRHQANIYWNGRLFKCVRIKVCTSSTVDKSTHTHIYTRTCLGMDIHTRSVYWLAHTQTHINIDIHHTHNANNNTLTLTLAYRQRAKKNKYFQLLAAIQTAKRAVTKISIF